MHVLIESWDGHAVVTRYDQPTGTWMFVAIHTDRPEGHTVLFEGRVQRIGHRSMSGFVFGIELMTPALAFAIEHAHGVRRPALAQGAAQ